MKCSKCQSEHHVKNGIIRGVQRYKCKECGNNFSIDYSQVIEKEKKRRFGLAMYLEGLGFHSIGRLLNVSHVTVMNWVEKYGKGLSSIRNPKPVQVMELDEIHSYVGSKKTIDGFGLLLIERHENSLILFSETGEQKQVESCGIK
jgi:Transposase and inactivated derivatives